MAGDELLEARCVLCTDSARGPETNRVELERWLVWHVYWCHIDAWTASVGDREPRDPMPRPGTIETTADRGTRGEI